MRCILLAALIGLISTPHPPTALLTGSLKCDYLGTWGCAPPKSPAHICVDGGIRHKDSKRYVLRANFDSGRIRLNDIAGSVEPSEHWVYWDVGGIGRSQLSVAGTPGHLMLSHLREDGSAARSEFKCIRTRTMEL